MNNVYLDHTSISIDIRDAVSSLSSSVSGSLLDISMDLGSIDSSLSLMNDTLGDMLWELMEFRTEQFIQNEHRNMLLESINHTLKTPSQTAAEEKYQLAMELVKRKDYQRSCDYFLEAIQLNPLHFFARIYLSNTYNKMKRHDEALDYALESFSHTTQNKQKKALAHFVMAKACFGLQKKEQAIREVEQAIELDPLAMYYYDGARYYAYNGDASTSMNRLLRAINKNREYFEYALLDRIFEPFQSILMETLTDIKKQTEAYVVATLKEWQSIPLPDLPLDFRKDINTYPTRHQWLLKEWNHETFTYNEHMKKLKESYRTVHNLLLTKLTWVERKLEKATYLSFCEALDNLYELEEQYIPSIKRFEEAVVNGVTKSRTYLKMTESDMSFMKGTIRKYKQKIGINPLGFMMKKYKFERNMIESTTKNLEKMNREHLEARKQEEAFGKLDYSMKNSSFPSKKKREKFSLLTKTERQWVYQEAEDEFYPYDTKKVISLLQAEKENGQFMWSKSDTSEWVGTNAWMVKLTFPNTALQSFLEYSFKGIPNNQTLTLKKDDEITERAFIDLERMIGDISQYEQALIGNEVLKDGEKAFSIIEWNETKILLDHKFVSILKTNIVHVKKENRPLLFGDDYSVVIMPTTRKI